MANKTAPYQLSPIQKFIRAESFSGIVLFFATLLALIFANSYFSDFYESIWKYKIGITSEGFSLVKPVILWVNDGLMAIFFFLIGLEIKREIVVGELNSIKKASLPIFAAIGGMLVPLALYLLFNSNPDTANGWGISMATDIAFTLAILKILGKKVPLGLKIFLTAFAIIDDLGAVIVIALFYSSNIYWDLILYAGILLAILYAFAYFRVHSKMLLFVLGVAIWVLFLKGGIHPTIAGILIALSVPIRQRINEHQYAQNLQSIMDKITISKNTNQLPILSKTQIEEIDNLESWTEQVQSPLQSLEHRLHNWVAYMIMPVFAFANAGVSFAQTGELDSSLMLTIVIALFVGKALGVSLFSYLGIKLNMATLPEGVSMMQIVGVGVLSGVGFTMSLFIGNLAFIDSDMLLNSAKTGVLIASLISGVLGYIIIRISLRKKKA